MHLLLRAADAQLSGLSPGADFESRIYAKVNAAELLEREISRKRYVPEPIALGVNTDAYQPVERDLRITRSVIQVMHDRGLPSPRSRSRR